MFLPEESLNPLKKLILIALFAILMWIACSEITYWLAGKSIFQSEGICDVLVLGYPSETEGSAHPIQHFRVKAAVNLYHARGCRRLILSGGAIANQFIEAETMAEIAKDLGMVPSNLLIERSARSTWENIGCTLPHTDAERIFVVSNSLHARRAVRYVCRQAPARCEKYQAAGIPPPIELFGWRYLAIGYEIGAWIRDALLYRSGLAENGPACARKAD